MGFSLFGLFKKKRSEYPDGWEMGEKLNGKHIKIEDE